MSDPSLALQVALFERLSACLSCPVFDAVPAETPYPYVTLDYEIADDRSWLERRMEVRFQYLTVWSQHRGQSEVKRILGEIGDALHDQRLSLATGRAVSVRVQLTRTNREPDGLTYQGQVTLRVLTTH